MTWDPYKHADGRKYTLQEALNKMAYLLTEEGGIFVPESTRNDPDGFAGLDGSGLLSTAVLPPLAISEVFVVANETEMLALTAQIGDVAKRTDTNVTYMLKTEPASVLGNWVEIADFQTSFLVLTDTPSSYSGQDGKPLVVDETGGAIAFDDLGTAFNKNFGIAAGDVTEGDRAVLLTGRSAGQVISGGDPFGTDLLRLLGKATNTVGLWITNGNLAVHRVNIGAGPSHPFEVDNEDDELALTIANEGIMLAADIINLYAKGDMDGSAKIVLDPSQGLIDIPSGGYGLRIPADGWLGFDGDSENIGMYYDAGGDVLYMDLSSATFEIDNNLTVGGTLKPYFVQMDDSRPIYLGTTQDVSIYWDDAAAKAKIAGAVQVTNTLDIDGIFTANNAISAKDDILIDADKYLVLDGAARTKSIRYNSVSGLVEIDGDVDMRGKRIENLPTSGYPTQNDEAATKKYVDDQIGGNIVLSPIISPSALTGNVNDWNPTGLGTAHAIRADPGAGNREITGIVAQEDGRVIYLFNISTANDIKLKSENANSLAANRFALKADLTLEKNESVVMVYDGTTQRWRVAGANI